MGIKVVKDFGNDKFGALEIVGEQGTCSNCLNEDVNVQPFGPGESYICEPCAQEDPETENRVGKLVEQTIIEELNRRGVATDDVKFENRIFNGEEKPDVIH